MRKLFVTLCGDGPSDEMLTPVVDWTIRQRTGPNTLVEVRFYTRTGALIERLLSAVRGAGDCDLLVVHRDAERPDGYPLRFREIQDALAEVRIKGVVPPRSVPVIPVRMSEAWLLFDEPAIRRAAARPTGKAPLDLPKRDFDLVPDAKQVLNDALDAASELTGRKLSIFKRFRRPIAVAEAIGDFSPLRKLDAFIQFEGAIRQFVDVWAAEPTAD